MADNPTCGAEGVDSSTVNENARSAEAITDKSGTETEPDVSSNPLANEDGSGSRGSSSSSGECCRVASGAEAKQPEPRSSTGSPLAAAQTPAPQGNESSSDPPKQYACKTNPIGSPSTGYSGSGVPSSGTSNHDPVVHSRPGSADAISNPPANYNFPQTCNYYSEGTGCRNQLCKDPCCVIASYNSGALTIDQFIEYLEINSWSTDEMLFIDSILRPAGFSLTPVDDMYNRSSPKLDLVTPPKVSTAPITPSSGTSDSCSSGCSSSSSSDSRKQSQNEQTVQVQPTQVQANQTCTVAGSKDPTSSASNPEAPTGCVSLTQQFYAQQQAAQTEPSLTNNVDSKQLRRLSSTPVDDPGTLDPFFTTHSDHGGNDCRSSVSGESCEKNDIPALAPVKSQKKVSGIPNSNTQNAIANTQSQNRTPLMMMTSSQPKQHELEASEELRRGLEGMIEPLLRTFVQQFLIEVASVVAERRCHAGAEEFASTLNSFNYVGRGHQGAQAQFQSQSQQSQVQEPPRIDGNATPTKTSTSYTPTTNNQNNTECEHN